MEVEGFNPYGLYKNIVSRSTIPWLKSDRYYDDQTQGWWLCFADGKGEYYLVDTYHISLPSINHEYTDIYKNPTDAYIAQRIDAISSHKDDGYVIFNADSNYYYGGTVKVTEDSLIYFKLVCDLRCVRFCNNPDEHNPEDITKGVQLWFEHGYNWHSNERGVCLVRRGARIDKDMKVFMECKKAFDNSYVYIAPLPSDVDDYYVSKEVAKYRSLVHEYLDMLYGFRENSSKVASMARLQEAKCANESGVQK